MGVAPVYKAVYLCLVDRKVWVIWYEGLDGRVICVFYDRYIIENSGAVIGIDGKKDRGKDCPLWGSSVCDQQIRRERRMQKIQKYKLGPFSQEV